MSRPALHLAALVVAAAAALLLAPAPAHSALRSAVVVGAGPAGLAAAIALRLDGVPSVRLVERRRAYTRDNMFWHAAAVLERMRDFGMRAEFVGAACLRRQLAYSGAEDPAARKQHYSVGTILNDTATDADVDAAPLRTEPGARFRDFERIHNETQPLMTRCADLERIMLARAADLGVEVIHGAATVVERQDGGEQVYDVVVEGSSDAAASVLPADLVVAADGAHSRVRRALRIPFELVSPVQHYVAAYTAVSPRNGSFSSPSPGYNLALYTPGPAGETVSSGFFYCARAGKAWSFARVVDREVVDEDYYRALFLRTLNSSNVLLVKDTKEGKSLSEWTNFTPFETSSRIAERYSRGNVVLVGDAARTAHFFTAQGVNNALVNDVEVLRDLLADWRARGRAAATANFDAAQRNNSDAWIAHAEKLYVRAGQTGSLHPVVVAADADYSVDLDSGAISF